MVKITTYPRSYHLCVPIDRALKELKKGNNLFKCSPSEALIELTRARDEGKTFYSGCDNMSEEGRCDGHALEVVEEKSITK